MRFAVGEMNKSRSKTLKQEVLIKIVGRTKDKKMNAGAALTTE